MPKIMAIFAHPDDEGAVGGTLARCTREGHEVMLVCATRGEVGEISDSALATPETLAEVRQKELERACEVYGIQHLVFLDYRDSGMEGTPENADPRALVQADPQAVIGQMTQLIHRFQPDAVITFEPFGWYGHPDHRAVSRWATAAFATAGNSERHPESGQPWESMRLFHAVLPFSQFRAMMEKAVAAGYLEKMPFDDQFPPERIEAAAATEAAVTHIVDVRDLFKIKQLGMQAHQTQFGEESLFRKVPEEMLIDMWGREHFIQVAPAPKGQTGAKEAADLLDNVPE